MIFLLISKIMASLIYSFVAGLEGEGYCQYFVVQMILIGLFFIRRVLHWVGELKVKRVRN
jgi:hypothetical protein